MERTMRIGMMVNLPSGYPREGKKDSPDYTCMAVCWMLPIAGANVSCSLPPQAARGDVSVAVLCIRKRRGDTETVGGGGNSAAFGQSLLALHLGKIAGEPDDLAQLTVRIGSGSLYHAARPLIAPAEVHKSLSAGPPLNLPLQLLKDAVTILYGIAVGKKLQV